MRTASTDCGSRKSPGRTIPDVARAIPFHGDAEAPAVYLTGSGTTGEPKVVAMSERQLVLQADRGYRDYGRERVLRLASVEHNNSKRLRLYTLWQGGTCVLRGAAAASVPRLCERLAVSWLEVAPYHLEDLVRSAPGARRLPAHTAVRCGGARVPHKLRLAVLAEVTAALHVSYGTTETGGVCFSFPHEQHDPEEPVGRPLPGVEVEIVDAERRPVADGAVGEIRIRAPGHGRPATWATRSRRSGISPAAGSIRAISCDGFPAGRCASRDASTT